MARCPGLFLKDPFIGFEPVDARVHDHVEHQQVYMVILYIFDRFFPAGHGSDEVPHLGQNSRGDLPLLFDIVYHEDGFSLAPILFN